MNPQRFQWLAGHFDRLIGQSDIRPALQSQPADIRKRIESWTAAPNWAQRVSAHLLYE
jgi:hypothetical protein